MRKFLTFTILLIVVAAALFFLNKKENQDINPNEADNNTIVNNSASIQKNNINNQIPKKQNNKRKKDKSNKQLFNEVYSQILCNLRRKGISDIPLSPQSFITGSLAPELNEDGSISHESIFILIEDPSCPKGKLSFIKSYKNSSGVWSTQEAQSCHEVSSEKLFISFGQQEDIEYFENKLDGEFPLAISGPGLFLTMCSDQILLTRQGRFYFNEGKIITKGGCELLDRTLRPIVIDSEDSKISEEGCVIEKSNQCIALITKADIKEGDISFINSASAILKEHDIEEIKEKLKRKNRDLSLSIIIKNSLEQLKLNSLYPNGLTQDDFEPINQELSCL